MNKAELIEAIDKVIEALQAIQRKFQANDNDLKIIAALQQLKNRPVVLATIAAVT